MTRLRFGLPPLPHWTTRPGFGVAVLLLLAVTLIVHGEPQPSSRPSGTSVGVSGTATAPLTVPSLLAIRDGVLEARLPHGVRRVRLPAGARPLSVVTGRGLSVVLAEQNGYQRAYAVQRTLEVRDLGPADAAIGAATGPAAVLIETGLAEPGRLTASATPSAGPSSSSTTGRLASPSPSGNRPPDLGDFAVRRYDAGGQQVGLVQRLPAGSRMGVDSAVGLVVWQPVNRVFDNGVPLESLSALATLIRPDGSLRELGPVHPLAADAHDLLVWDVAVRRFGVMSLRAATSDATSTASPSKSRSAARRRSASPSASPSTVAGVSWFQPTRGITVVTGPASIDPDGSAFAVYAQVGSRRRLVVAELHNLGTDQVEVLALVRPASPTGASSTLPVVTGPATPGPGSSASGPTPSPASESPSKSAGPSAPALQPDGFPISAPLAPLWWNGQVVGLGTDGTVVGYRPGGPQSSLLDLGADDLQAFAPTP